MRVPIYRTGFNPSPLTSLGFSVLLAASGCGDEADAQDTDAQEDSSSSDDEGAPAATGNDAASGGDASASGGDASATGAAETTGAATTGATTGEDNSSADDGTTSGASNDDDGGTTSGGSDDDTSVGDGSTTSGDGTDDGSTGGDSTGEGSTGDDSTGEETTGGQDTDPLDEANFIFLSANDYAPNFADANSPFTGADAACQAEADAAGLPGTFVALLTADNQHPALRLSGARGWKNARGYLVADELQDFVDNQPLHTWAVDASGNLLGGAGRRVWTGRGTSCEGWTSTASDVTGGAGFPMERSNAFTAGPRDCDSQHRLFCAAIDNAVEQPVPEVTGDTRTLFIARTSLPAASGLAAFDQQCQADWDEANPGTGRLFTAWLAGDGVSAMSRIGPRDATWTLQNGAVFAESTTALGDADFETWPNRDADGGGQGPTDVWTGIGGPERQWQWKFHVPELDRHHRQRARWKSETHPRGLELPKPTV